MLLNSYNNDIINNINNSRWSLPKNVLEEKTMKISKIAAAVAAAFAVASVTAVSASAIPAGATSVDFEDGDCSFVYMNVDSGASDATLSV